MSLEHAPGRGRLLVGVRQIRRHVFEDQLSELATYRLITEDGWPVTKIRGKWSGFEEELRAELHRRTRTSAAETE